MTEQAEGAPAGADAVETVIGTAAAEGEAVEPTAEELAATEAAEAKTAEDKVAADKAADVLDFETLEVPEGFEVTEAHQGLLTELTNFEGTKQEQAAAILKAYTSQATTIAEDNMKQWEETQTSWVADAKAHKELGGDNFDSNIEGVNLLIEKYGTPEAREVFDFTGAGNHPEILAMLHRIADDVGEGSSAGGDVADIDDAEPGSRMFSSMKS